jgi:nucleoside-diphosphate-sugar epimerase
VGQVHLDLLLTFLVGLNPGALGMKCMAGVGFCLYVKRFSSGLKMGLIIIGGAGFIGTRLSDRLSIARKQFHIIDKVISKKYLDLTRLGDVTDIQQMRSLVFDGSILVNLAAEHKDNIHPAKLYYDVNVGGAKNICQVAREKNVKKIIFTSTVAVYGFINSETSEAGVISPFNDYGKSKRDAELVYKEWQEESPDDRTLVIIRPTVVFGEGNRGNVYNLLQQIYSNKFLMVGDGTNHKSLAYVENLAAFIELSMDFEPGIHIYNYVDKPDFTMNELVAYARSKFGLSRKNVFRIPLFIGLIIGKTFDILARLTNLTFIISFIRVKKFCSNSIYSTNIGQTGFTSPIPIEEALESTIRYEFFGGNDERITYFTE